MHNHKISEWKTNEFIILLIISYFNQLFFVFFKLYIFISQIHHSNASQVVLRNVAFGLSGNFSCEVTAESPSFSTATGHIHMQVVGKFLFFFLCLILSHLNNLFLWGYFWIYFLLEQKHAFFSTNFILILCIKFSIILQYRYLRSEMWVKNIYKYT